MSIEPDVRVSKWAFIAPFALGSILALSATSLFIMGWLGGSATGDRVIIQVQSACPAEWAERIEARGASVGLGDPQLLVDNDLVSYTVTLPGKPDDHTAMPALLTKTGKFEVFKANEHGTGAIGEALAITEDIIQVVFSLDARGHPYVDVDLQPHAATRLQGEPQKFLYFLDGQLVDHWAGLMPFDGETIRLQPRGASKRDNMREAVDWNIVLRDGPAPCEVQNLELKVISSP
jgi:hypothetical protein